MYTNPVITDPEAIKNIKNLSALMKQHGITAKELSEILGIAPITISFYVTGKHIPQIRIYNRLAKFFGWDKVSSKRGEGDPKAPTDPAIRDKVYTYIRSHHEKINKLRRKGMDWHTITADFNKKNKLNVDWDWFSTVYCRDMLGNPPIRAPKD